MKRVLPTTLITRLKEDPEDMLKQFDTNVDTPELIWDASMRNELRQALGCHIDLLVQTRTEPDIEPIDQNLFVKYTRLADEVHIGGVYVARFVKEPTYSLRDPTSFLEQLLQRWAKEIEVYTTDQKTVVSSSDTAVVTSNGPDILELVTTAIVYICKVRDTLCDKVAGWGYMARSVSFLDSLLYRNKTGTPLLAVIRLLHVCAGRLSNIEALALIGHTDGHQGVVEFIVMAIGKDSLHPDSAFMIEFLKRAYGTALGDVEKAHAPDYARRTIDPSFIAMAPSPASGDGPVRKKVSVGDDPLGMMQFEQQDQQRIPTPAGGVEVHTDFAQPLPMNMGFMASNSSTSHVGVNQYQVHTSQSVTNHQGAHLLPQTNPLSAQAINELRNLSLSQASSRFHSSIPSQPSYQNQGLPSYVPQRQSASQLPVQQHQNTLHQNYVIQQSSFGLPSVNQSVLSQEQYQHRHQNIGQLQRHQQMLSSERPHVVPIIQQQQPPQQLQQQQQQPAQIMRAPNQQYYHIPDTKMNQNNVYHQQQQRPLQPQPTSKYAQQQQYMQSPLINNTPSEQPHPSAQQFMNSAQHHQPQHHQPQHALHDRAHQTPTPNSNHAGAPTGTSGNLTSSQGAMQHQMQLPNNSPGYASGLNTHGGQQVQNSYMPPYTSAHDGNDTGNTSAAPDQMGLPQGNTMGSHQSNTNFTTNQPLSYKPTPMMEGMGIIDARSGLDPTQIAEHQKINVAGAPNSAHGRISWLRQAIATNLCSFLINDVLENATLKQVRDPDSAKVHAIALVKLLVKDPGYGAQFELILKEIPAWKKYKSQDHSLLITGHEQRADYFLTDGGSGVNKLLTDR